MHYASRTGPEDHSKVAYIFHASAPYSSYSTYEVQYPALGVNAVAVSSSYARLFFAVVHFRKTGEVIFAGLSLEGPQVIHAISKLDDL